METIERDLVIVGGGASGMAAAIAAKKTALGSRVAIVEKNQMLGRKLLASGNGKCNFSNCDCGIAQYNHSSRALIETMLHKMPPEETMLFLETLGVFSRQDSEGRVYPYTEQASSVKEAFEAQIRSHGIDCYFETTVLSAEKKEASFLLRLSQGETIKAKHLLLATGGKAGSIYGSDGSGYLLAKSFGHSLVPPHPALVQIKTSDQAFKNLKGVRAKGCVTLIQRGRVLASETGEIQFIENGLSGICIFDLSRYLPKENKSDIVLIIDLFPAYSETELCEKLTKRKEYFEGRKTEAFLEGLLNKKLIPIYLEKWAVSLRKNVAELSFGEIQALASLLKTWEVSVDGTKGWAEAQVTSGGISVSEINSETLESKIVSGLFLAGELMDVDGSCGGRNLQWAIASGLIAGKNAGK